MLELLSLDKTVSSRIDAPAKRPEISDSSLDNTALYSDYDDLLKNPYFYLLGPLSTFSHCLLIIKYVTTVIMPPCRLFTENCCDLILV